MMHSHKWKKAAACIKKRREDVEKKTAVAEDVYWRQRPPDVMYWRRRWPNAREKKIDHIGKPSSVTMVGIIDG
jgi:hypothetical protein